MDKKELDKILKDHLLWLNTDAKEGTRADLSYANLSGANLRLANLREANLREANLSGANLRGADLCDANVLLFQVNRSTAYYTNTNFIHIGCKTLTIDEWLANYKRIGKDQDYTKDEIRMYGKFIKMCAKLYKESK